MARRQKYGQSIPPSGGTPRAAWWKAAMGIDFGGGSGGGGAVPIDTSNKVFVILSMGQSNEVGSAEASRLALTTYPIVAPNVFIANKTTFNTTDNVYIEPIQGGINMRSVPTGSSTELSFGASLIAGNLLAQVVDNPVYIIHAARGGTALQPGLNANGDWSPAGTAFDYALNGLFANAIEDIQALQPGKDIEVIISWHQSEADNTDNTATTNYPTNFTAFKTAVEAVDPLLADRLWLITKPYYNLTANEDTINAFFDSLASDTVKIITIGAPRRIDLTADEIGGFAATGTMTDDKHGSYLQQIDKGEQQYALIKSYFNIGGSITEDTSNTDFPITGDHVRLQLNRSNLTISSTAGSTLNKVSAPVNSLSTGAFEVVGNARFKVMDGKGWFSTIASDGQAFIRSTTNIGTTLFAHSFSCGGWFWPINAQLQQVLFDDTQNISNSNSRFRVFLLATGAIAVTYGIGSFNQTNTPVIFSSSKISRPYHIAVTLTSGNLIRVYIDGVLQTLSTISGSGADLSAITMANYSNTLRPVIFGTRENPGPVYVDVFYGLRRELLIQPVVWSAGDIANIMLN